MPLGRLIYARSASNALQIKNTTRLAIREMLIPLIQSKWDVGPKTVLGPSRPPATYLRNADGRADNMQP
jgi:hypothetical protein